ncbi:hypothetical protein BDV95DRAFT_594689 [Massariosphaeria phaeospora]|uniref:Uncharacterized protein n=1 Tax=Massariosphaeria phaeospora TaxID=100035 RepID=A0A7C8MP12_9PLEO|nr:hypothetical protein BDV95DRAFT_594689 [Massariosphaeria phaeospora]
MGNCSGKLNCTSSGVVRANPDIAGNGILAAFLLSALMTIAAIIFGYLSDSLPDWYLNDLDKAMITKFQTKAVQFQSLKSISYLGSKWFTLKAWIHKRLGLQPPQPSPKLDRRECQEAVTRFILSLSDQQLATGLAILIAALSNQCTLSVQEFRITMSLAWFSSTTHLATLDSLRDYFISHGTIRNWRVFGMVAMLSLLVSSFVICMILALEFSEPDVPVRCSPKDFPTPNQMRIVVDFMAWALALAILISNYGTKIIQSYGSELGRKSGRERLTAWMVKTFDRKLPEMSDVEWGTVVDELRARRKADNRARLLLRVDTEQQRGHKWVLWLMAVRSYEGSFLHLAPSIAFMLSYGFGQLAFFRFDTFLKVKVDSSMGFGQITAMILLVLPILAAAEIYYESKGRLTGGVLPGTSAPINGGSWPRSDTIPITPGNSDASDLEPTGRDYDEELPQIRLLLYDDTKSINRTWLSASNDNEIRELLRAKQRVLFNYRRLTELENSLSITSKAVTLFMISISGSIALGVILNIPDKEGFLVLGGAFFLILRVFFGSAAFINRTFAFIQNVRSRETLDKIRGEVREDDTRTALNSTGQ